ncbi:MAG: tyrosine-type recombinase/integrase [Bacteroidota bacterium]|jgi:integrase|nr:site-specific integrase [Cytophagales bacterium]
MGQLTKHNKNITRAIPKASQVLVDYEYWLKRRFGVTGSYLANAKAFVRTYRPGGDLISQLEDYASARSAPLRSVLGRFKTFLEQRGIYSVINDLNEPMLPVSNVYVKVFLASVQDRLRSKGSMSTYATILNGYFLSIKDDVSRINKRTASKYVLAPSLSDYSKRLYKTVLKAFCDWALLYQSADPLELSREQKLIRRALRKISVQSLREVAGIKVILPRTLSSTYHKDSLTMKQRDRMLKLTKNPSDRAALALMAWNGLRSVEVLRTTVQDLKLNQGKLLVWGKGKSEKSKDTIKLASVAKRELTGYLKKSKIKNGRLFPNLDRPALELLVKRSFKKIKVQGRYTPHSLRHTAGQLMYEKGIPLELIQKTLRHADMRTTMIYSQKAIDLGYFKRMKRF